VEKRLREHVLAELPADARDEVAQFKLNDLLHVYGVWRDRLVPQRPRRVHVAKDLEVSRKAKEHREALDALIKKIEAGDDLTPHLSERVRSVYLSPSKLKEGKKHLRKDRDGLLADWGIHHLHLSTEPWREGLVRRTRDLLFAIFRPADAYLLGIYPHLEWAPLGALEIVVRNWPAADLMLGSMSDVRASQTSTDEERLAFRNAGGTGLVEIDGRVFMPRGQTGDGTPIDVIQRVHAVAWALTGLREGRYDDLLADVARRHDVQYGRPPLARWLPGVIGDQCVLMWESSFVPLAWLP